MSFAYPVSWPGRDGYFYQKVNLPKIIITMQKKMLFTVVVRSSERVQIERFQTEENSAPYYQHAFVRLQYKY